jgi:ABC-type cobalamin/Fe3+-siderophores transport system ATPase subunit
MQAKDPSSQKHRFGIPVKIEDQPFSLSTRGLPTVGEREFGRVIVLLGANGSGKSRLLKLLAQAPIVDGTAREVVYVEGGRALVAEPRKDVQIGTLYQQNSRLSERLAEMFQRVESERSLAVTRHKERLYAWDQEQQGDAQRPKLSETKFDRVRKAFSSLFPDLQLRSEENRSLQSQATFQWFCKSSSGEYNMSQLSDGEKQVLCLLCDVGELSPEHSLIIVDEPELNLHPSLALNLWNSIEQLREKAVFVYATHSLSFAMRPSVTDVIILGKSTVEPIHLHAPFEWSQDELGPFLGAIPAVITSKRLLAVEGTGNKSFDGTFYQWLIGSTIKVTPVGSCDDVRNVTQHHGIWSMVGDARICGIIDRDYKTKERLDRYQEQGCLILNYHEVESFLCHPAILHEASRLIGRDHTEDDIRSKLIEHCETMIYRVAMCRATARSEIRLSAGRNNSEPWPKERACAIDTLRQWADRESPRATNFREVLIKTFEEEFQNCRNALDTRDIDAILTYFPGKELVKRLATYIGSHSDQLLVSVTRTMSPEKYPHLLELKQAIGKHLT